MKEKEKLPSAKLEEKRPVFFMVGLIIALSFLLFCFEVKTYQHSSKELPLKKVENVPLEFVPITKQKIKLPPPPSQPPTINVVSDEIEVEEEIILDVETDQETAMEEYFPLSENDFEQEEEEIEDLPIFMVVESMPEFPGGEKQLHKYLLENINYPSSAKEAKISGRVFLTFVIETDGSVTDVRLLRGIGGGCDEEAIRVVSDMPKWKPGKQRGKAVRVQYNLPVKFTLY